MDTDDRWMPLVELFDPLPRELADLIRREDEKEVYLWVDRRLRASMDDIFEFRAANPRLDQLLVASPRPPTEQQDLLRYHEEIEQKSGVVVVWLKRLLAARTIGPDSVEWPAASPES